MMVGGQMGGVGSSVEGWLVGGQVMDRWVGRLGHIE